MGYQSLINIQKQIDLMIQRTDDLQQGEDIVKPALTDMMPHLHHIARFYDTGRRCTPIPPAEALEAIH